MTKGAAQVVGLRLAPIVGQLDHRVVALVAVTDKGEGELPARVISFAQQLHSEQIGIKLQRRVKIADPDHRVQEPKLVGVGSRL